jgi:cyclophilin family peptidyl-prolyl cis-trans isomerase
MGQALGEDGPVGNSVRLQGFFDLGQQPAGSPASGRGIDEEQVGGGRGDGGSLRVGEHVFRSRYGAVMLAPRTCAAATLLSAIVAMSACGGGDDTTTSTTSGALPEGCADVKAPAPKKVGLKAPKKELPRSAKLTAVVHTSCGDFSIALDAKDSPRTVSSFVYLARKGVYDDTLFHKIIPNFVIQGGDPRGDGSGGPGYFVDEPPPPQTRYVRNTVAMAKTQVEPPGRSGSQFFVVTAADAGLPPDFALLGTVSSGEDVVKRVSEAGDPNAGEEGTPLAPVVIDGVTVGR